MKNRSMKLLAFSGLLVGLVGCSSQISVRETASQKNAIDELKIELMDIRAAHGAQQMELELVQEAVNRQKGAAATREASHRMEKRLAELEVMYEKICQDLIVLRKAANDTATLLQEYKNHIYSIDQNLKEQEQKMGQVAELKSTLKSVSKALRGAAPGEKTYTVKAGDTLGKIAYDHRVSLDELRSANGLKNDTILVGQELKIP